VLSPSPHAHIHINLFTRFCCHHAEHGWLRFNLHRFRQYDEQQLLLPDLIAELLAAVGLQPFTSHTWASLAACGIEVVSLQCCACMLCRVLRSVMLWAGVSCRKATQVAHAPANTTA
jgi:hypothetical protein